MDQTVRDYLDGHEGVASTRGLAALGVPRAVVARLVRTERLVRLRRDVLVDAEVWSVAQRWQRHVIRARAVMDSVHDGASAFALSHHSALCLVGGRLFDVDDRVHLVRIDGRRGRQDPLVHVHPPVLPAWVHEVQGLPCVRPELASLQVAGAFGVLAGLVAVDGLLHDGAVTPAGLARAAAAGSFNHGTPLVRAVLDLASPFSESAGETRSRWVMRLCGLPAPREQVEIYDAEGVLVARVDFLFEEERVVVEFDGRLKYSDPADLWAEKQREDRLRALGYEVVRLTWDDLARPEVVGRKIRAALDRAARRTAA